MAQIRLILTRSGDGCRVNNRRLEVNPGDTVGWHGSNTVGCVVFDPSDWPFTESYTSIDVPQEAQPAQYFTVRNKACNEEETCFYDYDCQACTMSKAGDVEAFFGGGARIIIR